MKNLSIILYLLLSAAHLVGSDSEYPKAKTSFSDFKGLVEEVESHRSSRLVDFNTFIELSKRENVVILDSRSKYRYDRLHLKGAKHMNFSDFTQTSLSNLIPDFSTTILIYCNNNFEGNQVDFASKVAIESKFISIDATHLEELKFDWSKTALPNSTPASVTPASVDPVTEREKPLMMALNIPTYINLYGYGYRNVYELNELVDVNDDRAIFEGSTVKNFRVVDDASRLSGEKNQK